MPKPLMAAIGAAAGYAAGTYYCVHKTSSDPQISAINMGQQFKNELSHPTVASLGGAAIGAFLGWKYL